MGLRLFFIGMLFLANPNINIIDVIPDFIGLGLMWIALSGLRDLSSDISAARRGFAKLFWVEIAKLFAVLFMRFFSADSGFLLVFSFGFTIVELIFFIPALNSFFGGMMFLGTKYDGESSLSELHRAGRTTLIFIIAREILTFLPQLSYLYVEDGIGYVLEPYIGVVLVLSAFFQLVFGIAWVIVLSGYFKALKNDRPFLEKMQEDYTRNIIPDTGRFTKRALKSGFVFLGTFVLFSFNIYIDGNPAIPPVLPAISCFAMVFAWRRYIKMPIALLISAAVCGASATAMRYYGEILAEKYYLFGISKSVEAYKMFMKYITISSVNSILICIFIIFTALLLFRVINDHTGVKLQNHLESVVIKERERKKSLRKLCAVWSAAGIICALSSAMYSACLYLWQPYWIIDLALHITWFCITLKFIFSAEEQIEVRYL